MSHTSVDDADDMTHHVRVPVIAAVNHSRTADFSQRNDAVVRLVAYTGVCIVPLLQVAATQEICQFSIFQDVGRHLEKSKIVSFV